MENKKDPYRTLNFLVDKGDMLPPLTATFFIVLGVWGWWITNALIVLAIGLGAAGFMFLIMRSYVELVRVIVDMLLPK